MSKSVFVLLPEGVGIEWQLTKKPSWLSCATLANKGECHIHFGSGDKLCAVYAVVSRLREGMAEPLDEGYLSSKTGLQSMRRRIENVDGLWLGQGESILLYRSDPCGREYLLQRVFAFSNRELGTRLVLHVMGGRVGLAGSSAGVQSMLNQIRWVDLSKVERA